MIKAPNLLIYLLVIILSVSSSLRWPHAQIINYSCGACLIISLLTTLVNQLILNWAILSTLVNPNTSNLLNNIIVNPYFPVAILYMYAFYQHKCHSRGTINIINLILYILLLHI